jgi:hypothetical protein
MIVPTAADIDADYDWVAVERLAAGERVEPRHPEDVDEAIRRLSARDAAPNALAIQFNVSMPTVAKVLAGGTTAPKTMAHGTNAGYSMHYERGIPVCDDCRRAHNTHVRRRERDRRRLERGAA